MSQVTSQGETGKFATSAWLQNDLMGLLETITGAIKNHFKNNLIN